MNPINALGLKIVLAVVALFLIGAGLWGSVRYVYQKISPPEASVAPKIVLKDKATPTDSDGDGIPDEIEVGYGTDSINADSDGDGVNDLDELKIGRNPSLPGPSDEVKPATGQAAREADYDPNSYTAKYLATLPNNAAREDILNAAKIQEFIAANDKPLLPSVAPQAINKTSESGQGAVNKYLQDISTAKNSQLTAISSEDIETAFKSRLSNPKRLPEILQSLKQNVSVLKTVPVPPEAVALHQKYLAASQALVDNVTLLNNMENDIIGGLLGAKKVGDLGPVFQDIARQVDDLAKKNE